MGEKNHSLLKILNLRFPEQRGMPCFFFKALNALQQANATWECDYTLGSQWLEWKIFSLLCPLSVNHLLPRARLAIFRGRLEVLFSFGCCCWIHYHCCLRQTPLILKGCRHGVARTVAHDAGPGRDLAVAWIGEILRFGRRYEGIAWNRSGEGSSSFKRGKDLTGWETQQNTRLNLLVVFPPSILCNETSFWSKWENKTSSQKATMLL